MGNVRHVSKKSSTKYSHINKLSKPRATNNTRQLADAMRCSIKLSSLLNWPREPGKMDKNRPNTRKLNIHKKDEPGRAFKIIV